MKKFIEIISGCGRAFPACFAAIVLVACTSAANRVPSGSPVVVPAMTERTLPPNPVGEVIGSGNVRVALLVPLTIPGDAAKIAKELRNGAAMAMQDFGRQHIQLVVKNTEGQAVVSQAAAAQAVDEGSSLILGPLFAANVSAASGAAQPASVPMLAFSTDTTVARRGVYLFSYTPQADTQRTINFTAKQRRSSIVAFLPVNAEGSLRERLVREAAGARNIDIQIVRYQRSPEGLEEAIVASVLTIQTADTIYIPEGGPIPALILGGLQRKGGDLTGKQVLGSGSWESVKTSEPVLQGAIYPGRDVTEFNRFADRYQQEFGNRPGVQAAIAYDAVTLVSELARINGPSNPYPRRSLESPRGFKGINGAFRIRPNGITERGLAIYKIEGGEGRLLEPAISTFSGF